MDLRFAGPVLDAQLGGSVWSMRRAVSNLHAAALGLILMDVYVGPSDLRAHRATWSLPPVGEPGSYQFKDGRVEAVASTQDIFQLGKLAFDEAPVPDAAGIDVDIQGRAA